MGALMNRGKHLLLLSTAIFLLTASSLYGQTAPAPVWTMIAPESITVAVVLPAGTTYRFGDSINNRWSASITVNEPTPFSPVANNSGVFPFSDPDPGVVKELDVLETSAPQAVLVTNLAAAPATAVSLTVPPLVAPASVPMTPGTTYTLTFSNFTIAPGSAQGAPMIAVVNAPPTMAYKTWEGTQMNLTIDGVTLVCTPTQNNTTQTMNLNCVVPATTGSVQIAGAGQ
jgi:hypothetical protein